MTHDQFIVENYLRDLKDGEITEELLEKAAEHGDVNAEEALRIFHESS